MEHVDDEGHEAETKITVKLTLQHKENITALEDNLDVLNVLSIHDTDTLDDLVEHVEDDAETKIMSHLISDMFDIPPQCPSNLHTRRYN